MTFINFVDVTYAIKNNIGYGLKNYEARYHKGAICNRWV